ncbi:MAG: autotransporter outer membrane beta-barrel domain-containing protein, partial [Planctomycetota bacterium]
MNRRFKPNQHIFVSGLAFSFAIAFLLCSTAIGQPEQIEPNPNPLGETITITNNSTDYAFNDEIFDNLGTIDNLGYFRNRNTFNNDGLIDNSVYLLNMDTINNSNNINNSGTIDNGDTINNDGIINNDGLLLNFWIINNDGTINNHGTINSYGTINNTSSTSFNSYDFTDVFAFNNKKGAALYIKDGDFDVIHEIDCSGLTIIEKPADMTILDFGTGRVRDDSTTDIFGRLIVNPDGLLESESSSDIRLHPDSVLRIHGSANLNGTFTSSGNTEIEGNADLNGVNFFSDSSALTIKSGGQAEFGLLSNNTFGNTDVDEGGTVGLNGQTVVRELKIVRVDGTLSLREGAEVTTENESDVLIGEKGELTSEQNSLLTIGGSLETKPGSITRFLGPIKLEKESDALLGGSVESENDLVVDGVIETGSFAVVKLNGNNNLGPGRTLTNNGFLDFGLEDTTIEGGESNNNAYVVFNGQTLIKEETFNSDGGLYCGLLADVTFTNSTIFTSENSDIINEGDILIGKSSDADFRGSFGLLNGTLEIDGIVHSGGPLKIYSSDLSVGKTGCLDSDDELEIKFGSTTANDGKFSIGFNGNADVDDEVNNLPEGILLVRGKLDITDGNINNQGNVIGPGTIFGVLNTGTGTVGPGESESAGTMHVV